MRHRTGLLILLAALLPAASVAATLVADAQTLGVNAAASARIPAARSFTVTTAGQVQVRLRDLGTTSGASTGFTQLQAVVSLGSAKVASLPAAGTQQFAATPGTYKLQVVGTAVAPGGTFDIEVTSVGSTGAPLLQFADGILAVPTVANPAASNFELNLQIAQPGSYQVVLTDQAFPAALSVLNPILLSGTNFFLPAGPCAASSCTISFNVPAAGSYQLLVPATAGGADQAGLYSVLISGGPAAATLHASMQSVGKLPAPQAVTLPAGGGFTLALADFATPVALSRLQALVSQGASSLGMRTGAGSTALTGGIAGAASLFVIREAAAGPGGAAGSYGVSITQGAATVYRDARPVPEGFDSTNNIGGYRFPFTVPATGNFRTQLRDLAFPTAFASLRGVIVQGGSVAQTLASGAAADATLAGGESFALIFGTPASATSNSLFGLSTTPAAGGTALLNKAQGVGPLIATSEINIPTAGSHDLIINDLNFPLAFQELAVAVTQGPNLIGQIFGSGKITFSALAGPHSISLIARPAAAAEYATWGFDVSTTPPAPVIVFTAAAATVANQGTTTLTWSATNANTCTASGGWSGTRALSGSETTAALTVGTTFTLACVGAGGSADKSVTVGIQAAAAAGGGGRLDLLLLGILGVLLATRFRTAIR